MLTQVRAEAVEGVRRAQLLDIFLKIEKRKILKDHKGNL